MTASKTLSLNAHRTLWFISVSATLTGLWLAPGALLVAIGNADLSVWIVAGIGWIVLIGGVLGWSHYSNSGSRRQELVRITQTVFITFVTFVVAWYVTGVIGINYRVCLPGGKNAGETNGPSAIFWLAPAIAYYSLGYAGFARSRWIRFLWPLAVIAGVFVLFAIDLIWTTGSGCGD